MPRGSRSASRCSSRRRISSPASIAAVTTSPMECAYWTVTAGSRIASGTAYEMDSSKCCGAAPPYEFQLQSVRAGERAVQRMHLIEQQVATRREGRRDRAHPGRHIADPTEDTVSLVVARLGWSGRLVPAARGDSREH